MEDEFEIWLSEQAHISAAEIDSPNSPGFDALCKQLCENKAYRNAMRRVFDLRVCIT